MSTLAEASPSTLPHSATVDTAMPTTKISFLSDLMELAKIRLTGMVVITTMVGFWLGGANGMGWIKIIWAALGTWLVAGSAATLNQLFEISRDSLMKRTQRRPCRRAGYYHPPPGCLPL